MLEQIQRRYDLEAFRGRIPSDHGELFVGFAPWLQDVEGWRLSSRETLFEQGNRPLRRAVWDDSETAERRVLIDVVECSSAPEAVESLADHLEGNQLADLPEGPEDLGTVSFVHPEGVPPAVFFARGNLSVSVISFAHRPADALTWAQRLSRRLDKQPEPKRRGLSVTAEQTQAKVGEVIAVTYDLPWTLPEDGYLKFSVRGGTIARRDTTLLVTPTRPGELELLAIAFEPGRPVEGGRLSLTVE